LNLPEIHRKLLFQGYSDIADFLKDSPLNRYLYKRILGILTSTGTMVPVVTLFNEIYFQCVRVNYDPTPGSNIEQRYWLEEENYLHSPEGTQLIFCVVWSLLNVKRNLTFHEECFLRGIVSFIRNSTFRFLAEELPRDLLSNKLDVPERFPAMTCPIEEVDMLWDRSMFDPDIPINSRKYLNIVDTLRYRYYEAWKEITGGYSPTTIEKYVRLYSRQEDQLTLVSDIKTGRRDSEDKKITAFFEELEQQIKTGSFDMSKPLSIPSAIISDTDTEGDEPSRIHVLLDDADGDSDLDLIRHYKQERNALRSEKWELVKSHSMELARMEAAYKAEMAKLQKENNRFIRWRSKKRTSELKPSEWSSEIPMFNLNEMVEYITERFSMSSAEEVCAMFYHLVVKHGMSAKDTLHLIDSIVPAIMKRHTPRQIFEMPNVSQFNNNPGTVVNNP
jgi:hypothetical protein